jgi:RHS repeat-associated protein
VVAVTNSSGTLLSVNTYDEYGIPRSTNAGRFQYTGQTWLPELGMYYYKSRIYSPTLGRFLQTDPVGYGAGMNRYAYVGENPVNFTDPLGLRACSDNEIMWVPPHQAQPGQDDGHGGGIVEGPPHVCISASFLATTPGLAGAFYGSPGGGSSRVPSPIPPSDDVTCKGPRVNTSYGFSATGTIPAGAVNGSVNITISRLLVNNSWNPFKGMQVSINIQGAGMAGLGIFYGAGEQYGVGVSNGPAPTGLSTSDSIYAEGDLGAEVAGGVSIQGNSSGVSGGASGKVGVGVGAFVGVGKAKTLTLAAPPIGC